VSAAAEPGRRPSRGVTVREALDSARTPLRGARVDSPRLDAELLLAEALGIDRTALFAEPERELDGPATRRFQALVRRRAFEREPIAYLLGRKGFRHLELAVDRRVLVPRPETETLVEAALGLAKGATVVDVGTGSGAVALALKHERPDLSVLATEIDLGALAVARANAERLGIEVELMQGDLLEGVEGPVDAVVSNPPYVAEGENVPPELGHEPRHALLAGADGLELIRRLVPQAAALAPFVVLEVGAGQADAVAGLMGEAGLERTETVQDLAGVDRVVIGRRPTG
jgi:release factor glutamine methyltransferase